MSRWYIIHAYSGFENKVRDAIMSEATRMGLTPFVEQIEVPTETVTEIKRGKRVEAEPVRLGHDRVADLVLEARISVDDVPAGHGGSCSFGFSR
jgi:transcription antitermination factor NusG